MTLEQPLVANPVERLPARAPVQPRVPEPSNEPIEPLETAIVRRSPVVLVVAPEFGIERRGLMLDRVVPMVLAPLRHRLHTASKAFAHGPDVNRKPPPSAAAHTCVKPRKSKVAGFGASGPLGRTERPNARSRVFSG